MLLCTQLAPARQVVQVGEKINTSRVWPSARLNSDLRAEMAVSETMARELVPGRPAGAGVPAAVDAGDAEHEASTNPAPTAATAARASRALAVFRQAIPIASLFPLCSYSMHRAGVARERLLAGRSALSPEQGSDGSSSANMHHASRPP
jgi:hypothetical protein